MAGPALTGNLVLVIVVLCRRRRSTGRQRSSSTPPPDGQTTRPSSCSRKPGGGGGGGGSGCCSADCSPASAWRCCSRRCSPSVVSEGRAAVRADRSLPYLGTDRRAVRSCTSHRRRRRLTAHRARRDPHCAESGRTFVPEETRRGSRRCSPASKRRCPVGSRPRRRSALGTRCSCGFSWGETARCTDRRRSTRSSPGRPRPAPSSHARSRMNGGRRNTPRRPTPGC